MANKIKTIEIEIDTSTDIGKYRLSKLIAKCNDWEISYNVRDD